MTRAGSNRRRSRTRPGGRTGIAAVRTLLATPTALAMLAGCSPEPADGPPEIHYGESVCVACGMIVSDERYATATIVEGDRGPEPRVFDDFNCQARYEAGSVPTVLSRWVHDHESRTWLPAASAFYVRSQRLQTPMASGTAAFADRRTAARFATEMDGEVLTLDELRSVSTREI